VPLGMISIYIMIWETVLTGASGSAWIFIDLNLYNPYVITGNRCWNVLHSPETLRISITEKAAEKVKAAMEKRRRSHNRSSWREGSGR
jgi:hypothetical protein